MQKWVNIAAWFFICVGVSASIFLVGVTARILFNTVTQC